MPASSSSKVLKPKCKYQAKRQGKKVDAEGDKARMARERRRRRPGSEFLCSFSRGGCDFLMGDLEHFEGSKCRHPCALLEHDSGVACDCTAMVGRSNIPGMFNTPGYHAPPLPPGHPGEDGPPIDIDEMSWVDPRLISAPGRPVAWTVVGDQVHPVRI